MSDLAACSEEEEQSSGESGESDDGSDTVSGSSSYVSTESENGSESEPETEEEEEFEPVLKYKRFARDVIASISQGQGGEESNVICCIAVHSKVCCCTLIRDTSHIIMFCAVSRISAVKWLRFNFERLI